MMSNAGTTVAGVPARLLGDHDRRGSTSRLPYPFGDEQELVVGAIDSNWIAPLGPQVEAFESELASVVGVARALATSTGTAAIASCP